MKEFPEVFLDDFHGLTPHSEVDFAIETTPGYASISVVSYRMAPVKLQELKAVREVVRKRVYQTKYFPMECTSDVCEDERWTYEIMY